MAVEQNYTREIHQGFVQAGDGFQVQVVGGLIKNQTVGTTEHQLGKHTTNLLSSRKHLYWLQRFVATKKHSSQKASYIGIILLRRILTKPLGNVGIGIEIGSIVQP